MAISDLVLSNGNRVPRLGLGVFMIPNNDTAEVVERALAVGYRHFDTARIYGNERETAKGITRYLSQNGDITREDVFYTTKILPAEFGYDSTMKAVQESVDRIGDLKYIDLFLVHSPESTPEQRVDTYRALQDCVDKGLIKNVGVSNYGVYHLQELLEWEGLKYKPVVNQIEINPWLQQEDIVEFCEANEIVIEAYSPLILGKRFKDPELISLSDKYHKTPAQILIKWCLQLGYIPLPKSGDSNRLLQNFQALDDSWEISETDLQQLGDRSSRYFSVSGVDPSGCP